MKKAIRQQGTCV